MNKAVKPAETKTPAELVEEYIQLRDQKNEAKEVFKTFCQENFEARMAEIQGTILDLFNRMGVDSMAGKSGTAYRQTAVSLTVGDMRDFRRHIISSQNWDLVDMRPNKPTIEELLERGEPIPPGLNRSATYVIGIRRK